MHLRTILFTLALLAFTASSVGGYFYYSVLKDSATKEVYSQSVLHMEVMKNRVALFLSENLKLVRALAALEDLRRALNSGDRLSLMTTSGTLRLFRDALNVEACYLLDRQGNILASSDDQEKQTKASDRSYTPYFQQSVNGSPSIYMAVSSKQRSVYFSHPVQGAPDGTPIGVVVIETSIKSLEKELGRLGAGLVMLTDPRGIVFMSTCEDLLYRFLWKTSSEQASQDAGLHQLEALPLRWSGMEKRDQDHAVDAHGNEFLVYQTAVDGYPGWDIVCLNSIQEISKRLSIPFLRAAGYITVALVVLVGASVAFLFNKASQDISQRRIAEEARRKSEALYRGIVEDQTEFIFRFFPDGTLIFVNDAYCRYMGQKPEDLIGHELWQYASEKERKSLEGHVLLLSRENPVVAFEHCVGSAEGGVTWQRWIYRAILDPDGQTLEIQGVGRDVTERKRAEEALIASERKLRSLSSQLLKAQEDERKRIASELHDSIGSSLSAIKYSLESTLLKVETGSEAFEALGKSITTTQSTMEEIRRIMTDLRPSILDDLGIIPTINWFCRQFASVYSGITIEKELNVEEGEIPEQLKIVIFRVIQEAFHNIAKYSKADLVSLCLDEAGGKLNLVVRDNGIGFDLQSVSSHYNGKKGLGLTSMKERTEFSGGSFIIESKRRGGTVVHASWLAGEDVGSPAMQS